jgi:hypothetical protein
MTNKEAELAKFHDGLGGRAMTPAEYERWAEILTREDEPELPAMMTKSSGERKPMDPEEEIAQQFMEGVRGYVERVCEVIAARFVKLEAKVAELESKPSFKYCGVFSADSQYERGEFVTHAGSLWHAWKSTRQVPGTSDDWQLAVKRGSPGRDAR